MAWVVAAVVTAGLPALDLDAAPSPGASQPARPSAGVASRLSAPVTYRLGVPLPSLPGRARAWKVGGSVDAARVATLAAALGLDGQPREETYGWTVRDGRRALVAHKLAGVPWSYGTGLAVRPVAPARPFRPPTLPSSGRGRAGRARPGHPGRARPQRGNGAARRQPHRPGRHHRPGGGRGAGPGVLLDGAGRAKGVVQHASGHLATPEPAGTPTP